MTSRGIYRLICNLLKGKIRPLFDNEIIKICHVRAQNQNIFRNFLKIMSVRYVQPPSSVAL